MSKKDEATVALAGAVSALETGGVPLPDVVAALMDVLESRLMFGSAVLEAETLEDLQQRLKALIEDIAPVVEEDAVGAEILDALTFGDTATREQMIRTAEAPVARPDVTALRAHPRFVTRQKVELKVPGRDELRAYWTTDISRGGLFVESDDPPERGAELTINLETRDGALELFGTVVRSVRDGPMPSGVGIQFTNLTVAKRSALEAYVEGIATELHAQDERKAPPPRPEAPQPSDEALRAVREFLSSVEEGSYYEAIGVDPDASEAEIARRIGHLRGVFSTTTVSGENAGDLEVASLVLKRVEQVLGDPKVRISHELKSGRKTINELRDIYDEELLREAWSATYPERKEASQVRIRSAIKAADARRFLEAAKLAEEAAEDDPFDVVVLERAGRWRVLASLVEEMENGTIDVDRSMPMLAAAGVSVASARALWRDIFPSKLAQSSSFGREAVERLERGDVEGALKAARRALRLDPFNQRVRNVVSACERLTD
jgi:tetratricopeptide (TPR) repeat protein